MNMHRLIVAATLLATTALIPSSLAAAGAAGPSWPPSDKGTPEPPPAEVESPSIAYFYPDVSSLTAGQCTNLYWQVNFAEQVTLTGDFGKESVKPTGARQICPKTTTLYTLDAVGSPGAKDQTVSDSNVIKVSPAPIAPAPDIQVPPIGPPVAPPPAGVQGACTSFDLGAGAVVFDFDGARAGTRLGYLNWHEATVYFQAGSAVIDAPPVTTHSGSLAVRSVYDDFGSAGHPISFSFASGMRAMGMYVGREAPGTQDQAPVNAVLSAYGYDASRNLVEIATAEVSLPAEATPIVRCLVVRAPEHQGIRAATLEYETDGRASVYDHRWMDDLTVIGGAPAPDAPPTVTILDPSNGGRVVGHDVQVYAQIHEDVYLSGARYFLNGLDGRLMTVRQVPGPDPSLYEARATLPAGGLRADAANDLRVTASDSIGQTGEARISFGSESGGVGDIWITGIEVTQAIQTLDNRIPLIGGKPTAVRVYLRSAEDARGPWREVTASLMVEGRRYFPSLPVGTLEVSPAGSDRRTTRDSFVFLLDSSDTAPGSREMVVHIYSFAGRPESDAANNTMSVRATFGPIINLSIYGLAYQNVNPAAGPAPWPEFDAHRRYAEAVFPVTHFWLNALPGNPVPVFDNSANEAYLRAREWAARMLAPLQRGSRIYLLHPFDNGCLCGQADSNGVLDGLNNAAGAQVGVVMAQEVAHSFNLPWHAAASHPAPDPNYAFPYFHDSVGDQVGFDLRTLHPVIGSAGGHVHDIMSYGQPPSWISPFTYCAILRAIGNGATCPDGAERADLPQADMKLVLSEPGFPSGAWTVAFKTTASAESQEGKYLYVAGRINPDGIASFLPFEILSSTEPRTEVPPGGAYQLALYDGRGSVLAQHDFEPSQTHHRADEPLLFSLIVPYDPAVKSVILYHDKKQLAERKASPTAPQITLLAPNGGETWSGGQTIAWQASDADNDALTYTVEYSTDGGGRWTPLNTDLNANSLAVNFDDVPGSDNALVRVSATDGMNTTTDQSDASFSVPRKGPQVTLEEPAEGATYVQKVPFMASASAFDWEDQSLTDATAFRWTSNRDGELGSGPWIVLASLSPGLHTLTVTALDSDHNAASASVHIMIRPTGLSARDAVVLGGGAALFFVVALLVAAGAFRLKARARKAAN
jgi:hypothetical protein